MVRILRLYQINQQTEESNLNSSKITTKPEVCKQLRSSTTKNMIKVVIFNSNQVISIKDYNLSTQNWLSQMTREVFCLKYTRQNKRSLGNNLPFLLKVSL